MLYESPVITAYCVFVVALLGLCMGSFLNCLAWRMTHGESVLHGRSHCPSCGHVLAARDLVPVLSWVLSRGRCRYCGSHVSARYPATELVCAAAFVTILLRYDLTLQAAELMAFGGVLLVLSLTDLDDYVIPNGCIVAALAIRVAYLAVAGALGQLQTLPELGVSLASGLAVAGPVTLLALAMDHVLGRESFGGGDIKLLFVAGVYFGWQQCLLLIVVACVLGIAMGLAGQARAAKADASADKTAADKAAEAHLIPFGPSIALACWLIMLVGQPAVDWYLTLFTL